MSPPGSSPFNATDRTKCASAHLGAKLASSTQQCKLNTVLQRPTITSMLQSGATALRLRSALVDALLRLLTAPGMMLGDKQCYLVACGSVETWEPRHWGPN